MAAAATRTRSVRKSGKKREEEGRTRLTATKNCELFTGIVVVVVLAAFALDAQWLLFPVVVVVVVVIAALHFRFRFAASYRRRWNGGRATATRRLLSASATTSAPALRRSSRVLCVFSLTLNQYF